MVLWSLASLQQYPGGKHVHYLQKASRKFWLESKTNTIFWSFYEENFREQRNVWKGSPVFRLECPTGKFVSQFFQHIFDPSACTSILGAFLGKWDLVNAILERNSIVLSFMKWPVYPCKWFKTHFIIPTMTIFLHLKHLILKIKTHNNKCLYYKPRTTTAFQIESGGGGGGRKLNDRMIYTWYLFTWYMLQLIFYFS